MTVHHTSQEKLKGIGELDMFPMTSKVTS